MPRGLGAGAVSVSCGHAKDFGCILKRSCILLTPGGRPHQRRIEGWAKALRRGPQRGDFLVLIGWNQVAQSQGSRDFWKCSQTFGGFIGLFDWRRQYLSILA